MHSAAGRCAAAAAAVVSSLRVASRGSGHTPRPPTWAAGPRRRREPASQTRVTATSSSSTSLLCDTALSSTRKSTDALPPHLQRSQQQRHQLHSSHGDEISPGVVHHSATGLPATQSFSFSKNSCSPSPPAHDAVSETPQRSLAGMRSHVDAFGIAAPPPNSFAYVHAKSDSKASTRATGGAKKSPTTAVPGNTAAAFSPLSITTAVAVEGESSPIAVAPGAVRRALQHQPHSSAAESHQPAMPLPTSSDPTDIDRRLAHLLQAGAAVQPNSRGPDSASEERPAASLTPAQRQARRERQQRTRAARERRRLKRVQQGSGSTVHPCHVQGGCRHGASGVCPYRHFPADYCLSQLQEGQCALHEVGCCPWTHGDVGNGVVRVVSSSSIVFSADTLTPQSDVFARVAPLSALDLDNNDLDMLQHSSEKVGELLRLCVDAVVAIMEEATTEYRERFMKGAVLPSQRMRVLRDVLSAQPPGLTHSTAGDGFVRIEALAGAEGRVETLTVPAELAWCAMTQAQTPATTATEEEADKAACTRAFSSLDGEASGAAPEGSQLSREECAFWSSFFTCPTEDGIRASASVWDRTSAVEGRTQGEGEGSPDVMPTTTTTAVATSRVRLTPCVNAWVLDAAAAQLAKEVATAATVREDLQAVPSEVEHIPAPASPYACFLHATLYLLGWRRKELQRFLRGGRPQASESPLPEGRPTVAQGSTPRQKPCSSTPQQPTRWAPVSLLRDLLMASYIPLVRHGIGDAVGRPMHLPNLEDGGDGMDAQAEDSSLPHHAQHTLNSVLSLFLNIGSDGDGHQRSHAEALVHRGSLFSLAESALSTPAPQFRPTAAVQLTPSTIRSRNPNGVAALQLRFDDTWTQLHDLVLQLQWGVLNCEGSTPSQHGPTVSLPLFRPSAVALALFLQIPLLQLITTLSGAFSQRYETLLRDVAGWQPWTDPQLFRREHAAVYNAAAYARHSLPVVRLGLHNSLLNGLLLLSTRHASAIFHTEEPNGVRQLLLTSPRESEAAETCTATRWWAVARQAEHRFRQQHLRPLVSLSLGFLTALQELSRQQLSVQQSLMQEYEQRRTAFENAAADAHGSQRGAAMGGGGELAGSGGSRTRKYHARSREEQQAEQCARLEELQGVPLLDRLLPYGSVTVSPDATAMLLRHLLEGGHPYKALKLAASIVHASRMLRHADKQPRPVLQQGYRTVHARVWSRRLLRHVLVKKRVPLLRLVGEVEDDEGKPGALVRRAVRPIGLAFALSTHVVAEVARVGMRMGVTGSPLVDGVQQDCLRGALVDFTEHRGLPVPSLADVEGALRGVDTDGACEGVQRVGKQAAPHTPGWASASAVLLPSQCNSTGSCAGCLLRLMGVGDAPSFNTLFRTSSPSVTSPRRLSFTEGNDMGAPHRRIPPTPLLLELLQSHTPPSDKTRHTSYLRFLLQDVLRFSTWSVLFALQYQACERHSRYATALMDSVTSAARAMQTVYITTTAASAQREPSELSLANRSGDTPATWPLRKDEMVTLQRQLAQEAAAVVAEVREWVQQGADTRLVPSSSRSVVELTSVKAMLSRDARLDSGSPVESSEAGAGGQLTTHRAKLQLPVLLHHVWTTAVVHRSALQQCTALWAVCAATLLGTTGSDLRRSITSSGNSSSSSAGAGENSLRLALHHSYAAAGVQMRLRAPQQSVHYVDATVKVLLLSPVLSADETTSSPSSTSAYASSKGEWPMLLSSSRTATVSTLQPYVLLQRMLLTALLTEHSSAVYNLAAPSRADMQSFLNAFTELHGPLPDIVLRERPAWCLFQALLRHPALAHSWLLDTFLSPSPSFLIWLVAAMERTDAEGYAVLHTWLSHLPDGGRVTAGLRQTLLLETQRRHRGAVHRQRRHQRPTAARDEDRGKK
jgi:hypothetical protein